MSVVTPPSHCPSCGEPVKAINNVPIFGWLWLRGRAACCNAKLTPRYPLVELMSALLCVALAERFLVRAEHDVTALDGSLLTLVYFAFVGGLVVAAFVDLEWMEIPDEVSLPGAALGLLTATFRPDPGVADAALSDLPEGTFARTCVQQVRDAAFRGAGVTAQLSRFARRRPIDPRPVIVDELIEGTAILIDQVVGGDIEVVVDAQAGPGCVRTDPGRLEQVLLNLASNARDAMPRGGRLVLRTRLRESRVVLEVGPELVAGVAAVDAQHLLDRQDEDLAVAHLAGPGGGHHRVDRGLHEGLGDPDLDPHLLHQLHLHRGPAIGFHLFPFATVALSMGNGQAGHLRMEEGFQDFGELLRTNDGGDELHRPFSVVS